MNQLTQILSSFASHINGGLGNCSADSNILAFPSWYRNLHCESDGSVVFSDFMDVWVVVANLIEMGLRIAALAAVIFIVYGGIRYMSSQGSPDAIESAKKTITNAIVGLLLAILATTIVGFIAGAL